MKDYSILRFVSASLKNQENHSIKSLKNLIFVFITINLFFIELVYSQNSFHCGVLPPHQATSTNPDSIVYDRFGNSYDAYPAWTSAVVAPCNNSGYYHLECTTPLPLDMEQALCLIFNEMSVLFPRRNNVNECGDNIPQQNVNILINPIHGGQSNTGAASYLNFALTEANCTSGYRIETGRVYYKINGGHEKKQNFFFDGMMDINIDINWNLDFVNNPTPLQVDFRTSIKHEILHLMGIGSHLELDGTAFRGYYTLYDKYLGVIPYYNNANPAQDLISSNCLLNCFNFNASLFPGVSGFANAISNNCNAIPGGFDFVFKNPIVPISGGRGIVPTTSVDIGQMLSHFHESCNGIATNYIMQPDILPGIRRDILPEELGVMCTLGYQTNGGCDGCYLVNYYEKDLEMDNNTYSCCDNLYFTCKNKEITISFDELLCNNANNSNGSEITDVFTKNASIIMVPDYINKEIKVTPISEGQFAIYYTTTSCDCKMDNAVFFVYAGPCLSCSNSNRCTNLTKSNGFEEFIVNRPFHDFAVVNELSNGVYWEFANSQNNSVDVCQETNGNKFLHMNISYASTLPNKEGICLYLCEGIAPNCIMNISLDAAAAFEPIDLIVLASEFPPCDATDLGINEGCINTNCSGHTFDPECILNESIPVGIVFPNNPPCPKSVTFVNKMVTWTNTTLKTINYITIYPKQSGTIVDNSVFIDNVIVTNNCLPEIDFTFIIDCKSVSFLATPNLPDLNYAWNFDDGFSSSGANPDTEHTYVDNRTYEVTLVVTDQCGNMKTVKHNVTINCIPPSLCLCQNNNCIQIGSNGITTKVNNNGNILPNFFFGCYNICGTLDVNQNFNIGSTTLNMSPGSKIIVRSGVTLNIALTEIQGCSTMWQGIILEEGAHISLIFGSISDAEYAVDCQGSVTFDYCLSWTFRNNYVGIHAPAGGFKNIATPIFNGNLFDFNAWKPFFLGQNPLPQTRTFAGIEINNALMLLTSGSNNFLNLQNGIVCRSGGIVAEDCIMTNMIPESPFQGDQHCFPSFTNADGYGLYSNFAFIRANNNIISNAIGGIVNVRSFTNCNDNNISNIKYGIYSLNAIFGPVTASNNIINQFVHYGIRVISPTIGIRPVITDNQITAVGTGEADANDCAGVCIDMEDVQSDGIGQIENNNPLLAPFALGIRMSNCSNIGVQSNFVQNSVEGILNQTCRRCGIYSNECQGLNLMESIRSFSQNSSTSITYCCNTSNNSGFGFDFSGQNNPTPLFGNNIHSHINGLQIDEGAVIGDQFDRGNRWLNTALNGGHNAVNLNPTPDARNRSQFFITPCTNNFWPMPMSIFPSQVHCVGGTAEWFVISDNLSNACPINSCIPIVFPIPPYDGGGIPIITDYYNDSLIAISDLNEVLGWEEKRDLMYRLVVNPNLLGQNSIIDAFYNSSQNLGLKNFAINEISIINARNLSGTGKISLNSNLLSFENLINEWRDLDSNYISSGDTLWVNSLKAVKQVSMFNIMINTFALITQELLENETQLDQLILDNLSLEDNLIFKENEIVVNDIFLSTVARGIYSFTNEQINDLYGISIQCPNTGGRAVLMARKIYNYYNPTFFDDGIICNSQPIVLNNNGVDGEINKFKIFPNPTNKLLNIIPNNSLGSPKYEIRINAIGMSNIISNKMDVIKKGNSYEMDISTLVNGIYFVSIWNNGYNVYNSKFVKID